ncbi:GspH/FimT family pseudopilin [Azonexus fungiphilus]|uniref:GspH/FimT family pseudopilin n=1 Tax=Azonexus fungiphilus TaxID=146940 RepID=UPI000EB4F918|nr:GspH/FimT family pseudopilin [Azonexus fungiphilus]
MTRWRMIGQGAGFSLPELVIVLAIVAIVMLVGVPGMINLNRDAKLSAQTDQIVALLSMARQEAIKQRRAFVVCPATTPDTATACSTSASDWSSGILVMDGNTVFRRMPISSDVTLTYAQTTINFAGTLGSVAAAATINLCSPGRYQQQIAVTVSGRAAKRVNTGTRCT